MRICQHCIAGADLEADECKFTGFCLAQAQEPHGCPLEIRPRVLHLLGRPHQADARTLLMRASQRGHGNELVRLLAGADESATEALCTLLRDESLADMPVEGNALGDFEGQRRWAEAAG